MTQRFATRGHNEAGRGGKRLAAPRLIVLPKAPCPRCGATCNAGWIEFAGYCTACHKAVHGRDVGEKSERQKKHLREWDRKRRAAA